MTGLPWIIWTKRSKECLSRLMIEVWPIVRTEVDMIVNHINHNYINHHHIDHHQGILDNILNLMNFSTKRNCKVLYNDFEDDYEDERMVHRRRRRFTNSNPNRRGGFPIPNGEAGFLILFMTNEEDT